MKLYSLEELLSSNTYPGRGIVLGLSDDGKNAVIAYFIMGRSENSRNRIFVVDGDALKTEAFDPKKLVDPSLIIYYPVRVYGSTTIVTNGDQTETIDRFLKDGDSFENALRTREFEPDGPNFTPRISGMVTIENEKCVYSLSILKSANGNGESCERFFYEYNAPVMGEGRFIHTYLHDGNPIPSFEGEPTRVKLSGTIDEFTNSLWSSLNNDNKVSLFTRYISLETGEIQSRIVNKLN